MKTFRYSTPCLRTALSLAILPLVGISLPAQASTYTWTGPTNGSGDFNTPGSWSGGVVPGSADTAVIMGGAAGTSGTVGIGSSDNLTLGTLDMNESGTTGVTATVNQTGGTVTTGTFMSGSTGASKTFTYNLSGGNLNITSNLLFGAGSSGSGSGFVLTGGTVNYTGANDLILSGTASGGANYITVNAGTFSFTPPISKWLVVGQGGTGTINVGGTGKFNYDGNSNGALLLGQSSNSLGVMNVSGGVTSLTLNNGLYIGGFGDSNVTGKLNVSGGQVNIQNGGIHLGNSTSGTGTINITGGSVNLTSNSNITVGEGQSSTGSIAVTNGTFNYNGTGNINVGVGTSSTGNLTVGQGGVVNATSADALYIGNGDSANGSVTLSDNGKINTTWAVVGQYGSSAVGTVTIGGAASFNATKGVIVGGRYGGNSEYGVINLNGGTLTTPSISLGTTLEAVSKTQNVLNANGGTIVAGGTNGSTLVSGVYVNVQAGGLKVNTNGISSTISTALSEDFSSTGGGLTVTGGGSLTLSGGGNYTGDTVVNGATLILSTATLDGNCGVTLNSGKLQMGTASDDAVIQSLGALTLQSSSTIDWGTLHGFLTFADSSSQVWNGTLTLTNFDVLADSIAFGDGSGVGLTAAQLSAIKLSGYIATGLDSFGGVEFTAVPEPSTWAIMMFSGAGLLLMRRRRFLSAVLSK